MRAATGRPRQGPSPWTSYNIKVQGLGPWWVQGDALALPSFDRSMVGMSFSVRDARPDDLPAVLGLMAQLNPEDAPLDPARAVATWRDILARPGVHTLVACCDETVLACLTLVLVPNLSRGAKPYAMIENVVTDASHRGQRIGRRLLDAAVQRAWDAGAYKVMLMTGSKKESTLGFYRAAGFADDKTAFQIRRVDYVRD